MESINLLTNEFTAKSSNLKLARGLKIVGFILLSLFVVAAIAISVSFILTNRDLSNTKQSQTRLAESIRLMGDVENKYVLVKDRVTKTAEVLEKPSAQENTEYFNQFLNELPDDVNVTTINTEAEKIEFSINSASIDIVANILNRLTGVDLYNDISIESFRFSSESGYTLDFVMNN